MYEEIRTNNGRNNKAKVHVLFGAQVDGATLCQPSMIEFMLKMFIENRIKANEQIREKQL